MLRKLRLLLSFTIVLTAAITGRAEESTLEVVPSDASLVIRFKKPQAIVEKAAAFVNQVVPGAGDMLQQQSAALGMAISNPGMAGVDMAGDWAIVMFTNEASGAKAGNGEPKFVFVVTGTDLKAMQEGIGSSVQFGEKGKLGFYSPDEAAFKLVDARAKGEGKSISTSIDKDSAVVFEAGDVSVFINVQQLLVDYKDEISQAKEHVRQVLENGPPVPGSSGVDLAQITAIANKLVPVFFDRLNDAVGCTISVNISKEAISFEDLVKVKKDSEADKLLSKSSANSLSTLSSLPAGYLSYVGISADSSSFSELNELAASLNGMQFKGDDVKEFKTLSADLAKLKIVSRAIAIAIGDVDEGAFRQVGVTEVDNPLKFKELTLKMAKFMEKAQLPNGMKQKVTIKKDAEKFGANSADMVVVKSEFGEEAGDPMIGFFMEKLMSSLFGTEGATSRIVSLKDRSVETLGGGKQAMSDLLASLEKKSGSSKTATDEARAKLAPKANFIFLLDLPNTIAKFFELVVKEQIAPIPLPIDPESLKEVQSNPSYFGISASVEPQGIRVKTVFPVEQAQGIAKIVLFVQKVMQGG